MTSPKDLPQLLAVHACETLIKRFAQLNDAGDFDALGALLTADAVFARPSAPGQLIHGREAIVAAFKARPPRRTRHVTANALVQLLTPDTAQATSQVLLFSGAAGAVPTKAALPFLLGAFEDHFVCQNGCWLFSKRIGYLEFEAGLG